MKEHCPDGIPKDRMTQLHQHSDNTSHFKSTEDIAYSTTLIGERGGPSKTAFLFIWGTWSRQGTIWRHLRVIEEPDWTGNINSNDKEAWVHWYQLHPQHGGCTRLLSIIFLKQERKTISLLENSYLSLQVLLLFDKWKPNGETEWNNHYLGLHHKTISDMRQQKEMCTLGDTSVLVSTVCN